MEIGHLRPGIHATDPSQTVESVSSGWGIARQVQAKITNPSSAASVNDVQDLRQRCANDAQKITAVDVAEAALDGNTMAAEVISEAVKTLGWGIAQAIALMAPEVIVIGGGVPLMKESLFFTPLQTWIAKYVFPPLADAYAMRRAELGEEVVLHGGLLLAEQAA
jgi:glucokinase